MTGVAAAVQRMTNRRNALAGAFAAALTRTANNGIDPAVSRIDSSRGESRA
jgi:hypothetical protein